MQLYADAGSDFVTVEFEPRDVRTFASSWPCFRGPERVRFTFKRQSGDLVDMEPIEFDGPEASAMAEDAWSYSKPCRGLPLPEAGESEPSGHRRGEVSSHVGGGR